MFHNILNLYEENIRNQQEYSVIKNNMLKRICVNCGRGATSKFICEECENIVILECRMRKRRIKVSEDDDLKIDLIYFWDYESVVKKIITNGKYRFNKECFRFLAEIITSHYIDRIDFLNGAISYVPTTYLRFCYRGFNQAKYFADIFLKGCFRIRERPKLQKILSRFKYVSAQAKKGQIGRLKSKRQFKVKNFKVKDNYFVIFDDVCTTGSTLLSIQKEIVEAYPKATVLFVTIAYTKRFTKT